MGRYKSIDGIRAYACIGIIIMHVLLQKIKTIHLFGSDIINYLTTCMMTIIGAIVVAIVCKKTSGLMIKTAFPDVM